MAAHFVETEIITQPDCWRRAAELAPDSLPVPGERVAVVGCGTSWFVAQSYARLREEAGQGETDAFAASEFPFDRRYDRIVAITRSGTTTEVLDLLDRVRGATPAGHHGRLGRRPGDQGRLHVRAADVDGHHVPSASHERR